MHLLKIEQSGDLYASGEAVDLGQTPGRIAILTAADSEISLLAEAARRKRFLDPIKVQKVVIIQLSQV